MPSPEDYPSNAKGAKAEIAPVKFRGTVKAQKSSGFKSDTEHIGSYILYDILLPALRDLVSDIGHSTIDMAMGYDDRGSYTRSRSYSRERDRYVSYNRMYDDRARSRRDREEERYYSRKRDRDLDNIIFEYREDAEDVLDSLVDYLERYDCVTLSYFYDRCGMTVAGDFTSDDWGWTSLRDAKIRKTRRGWILDMPPVKPI